MKILISIILNSLILYAIYFFLWENQTLWLEAWVKVQWWISAFLAWWVILWLINVTIKPILELLTLPFFFLFFWLTSIIVNWVTLWLLDYFLNSFLRIPWIQYHISWDFNFIVAVAIFSILNIIYSLILNK